MTEYTYCKALLGSKYNDDYRHDRYFSHRQVGVLSSGFFPKLSELDNRRKKAFNIRNSIRYIEGVKQNCSRWENELTENLIEHVHVISKDHQNTLATIRALVTDVKKLSSENKKMLEASEKSSLQSTSLGWLSVVLAIIGIGFALLSLEKVCDCVGYCIIVGGFLLAIFRYGEYRVEKKKLEENNGIESSIS